MLSIMSQDSSSVFIKKKCITYICLSLKTLNIMLKEQVTAKGSDHLPWGVQERRKEKGRSSPVVALCFLLCTDVCWESCDRGEDG